MVSHKYSAKYGINYFKFTDKGANILFKEIKRFPISVFQNIYMDLYNFLTDLMEGTRDFRVVADPLLLATQSGSGLHLISLHTCMHIDTNKAKDFISTLGDI